MVKIGLKFYPKTRQTSTGVNPPQYILVTTSDDGQKLVPLSQYSQLVEKQEVEEEGEDEVEGEEVGEVTDIVVEEGEETNA